MGTHSHGSDHDHHDHHHDDDVQVSEYEVLERALRALLVEKGILTDEEVSGQIDLMDSRTPALGGKVVAKAWTDPDFKALLLRDTRAALAELGIDIGTLADFKTVENTADVHNVIVCTLCSCYPKMLLGIPPAWYKSTAYRSRVVSDPRGVLREFGLELPMNVEVRVHDSTADLRYLVLPMRPKGAERWGQERLASIVTRDCMVGTAVPQVPPRKKAAA
ncbi:MAG: nitrile hydratase subunit alpha [Hyphomicrobiaceae bacterium]|nr:nitrile hydratase subunit alpha [Hyphomicrobiaceae bacterium]